MMRLPDEWDEAIAAMPSVRRSRLKKNAVLLQARAALEASYDVQSGAMSGEKQRAAIAAIDAVLVSRDNDDGWIQHNGGPCPIPDAKALEYRLKWENGVEGMYHKDAKEADWENFFGHYRLIKPTPSAELLLRQAGEALRGAQAFVDQHGDWHTSDYDLKQEITAVLALAAERGM